MAAPRPRALWHERLILVAVAATILVVPLVVYLKVVPLDNELFGFWNGQRVNFDFFSFYKSRIIIGLAALCLAGLLAGIANGQSRLRELPMVARLTLAGYAALAIASTWGSPFRNVALNGFPDRYEGLFVLLAYLVLALAAFAVFTTTARVELAARCAAVSAIGVGLIGLLQYVGVDPFRASWGQRLILPAAYEQLAAQLQFPIETRPVYATLFHYNYVGSYTALILPFLIAVLIWSPMRRPDVSGQPRPRPARPTSPRPGLGGLSELQRKPGAARSEGLSTALIGAATIVIGLVWLVSGSRAGLTGGALAFAVLALGMRSRIQVRWRVVAAAGAALVLALVAIDLATGGRVRERMVSIASDVRVLFFKAPVSVPPLPIEIVRIERAAIHLRTPNGALLIRHENSNLSIIDEERGQPLRIASEPQTSRIRIDDERFSHFVCSLGRIGGQPAFVMRQGDYVLNFLLLDSGIRLALKTGRPLSLEKVETFGFEGREALGSARGYIWSRSLPLLRHTLFTGFGPDTFAMVFPQQDLIGKFRVYGTTDMLVDKVHNGFLQIALSTGVLSALLLIALFLWYVVASARIYFATSVANQARGFGLACFAGVVGYLGASLFNDSIVSVAPLFWVMLGVGMRMNVESTRQEDFSPTTRR